MNAPPCVPALRSFCVDAVATALSTGLVPATLGSLPEAVAREVTNKLSLDLKLEVAAVLIHDEDYWKRRAMARWRNADAAPHGSSWKQLYIERNLQEAVERLDPTRDDPQQLRRLMAFSRRFVQGVSLQQLAAQLDLQLLFDTLQLSLTRLALCYRPKAVGMDYSSGGGGMRLSDVRQLARALAHTETLVVLDLRDNGLDDDRARMLASGLADNISVTQLCLASNRVSDRGARALAKLLDAGSILTVLDLSGNQLQADSGRALARALAHSRALTSLNLRLNRLGDDGCRAICDALARASPGQTRPLAAGGGSGGPTASAAAASGGSSVGSYCPLERLDISSNGAGFGLVPALCSMLRGNTSLLELDVGCNALGERLSTDLVSAVGSNRGLLALEVRGCGLGPAAEQAVADIMLERAAKRQAARLCSWADSSVSVGGPLLVGH